MPAWGGVLGGGGGGGVINPDRLLLPLSPLPIEALTFCSSASKARVPGSARESCDIVLRPLLPSNLGELAE